MSKVPSEGVDPKCHFCRSRVRIDFDPKEGEMVSNYEWERIRTKDDNIIHRPVCDDCREKARDEDEG